MTLMADVRFAAMMEARTKHGKATICSATFRAVLYAIVNHADSDGVTYVGQDTIAEESDTSVRTVRRVIAIAKDENLIEVTARNRGDSAGSKQASVNECCVSWKRLMQLSVKARTEDRLTSVHDQDRGQTDLCNTGQSVPCSAITQARTEDRTEAKWTAPSIIDPINPVNPSSSNVNRILEEGDCDSKTNVAAAGSLRERESEPADPDLDAALRSAGLTTRSTLSELNALAGLISAQDVRAAARSANERGKGHGVIVTDLRGLAAQRRRQIVTHSNGAVSPEANRRRDEDAQIEREQQEIAEAWQRFSNLPEAEREAIRERIRSDPDITAIELSSIERWPTGQAAQFRISQHMSAPQIAKGIAT